MLGSELSKRPDSLQFSGQTLWFFASQPSYNSEREYCQEPANVARVEAALRKHHRARNCSFRIESCLATASRSKARLPEDADSSQSRYRRQRAEAAKEPLVKRAIEVLEAQLVRCGRGLWRLRPGRVPTATTSRTARRHDAMFKELGQLAGLLQQLAQDQRGDGAPAAAARASDRRGRCRRRHGQGPGQRQAGSPELLDQRRGCFGTRTARCWRT